MTKPHRFKSPSDYLARTTETTRKTEPNAYRFNSFAPPAARRRLVTTDEIGIHTTTEPLPNRFLRDAC
ncbi:MAG: hypothetical protein GF363_01710 [Chitinivibrionales bacterium]|nr:hypothetical protein [Chitinivibrionales bacterium]